MVGRGQDPDVAATLTSIAQSAGYKLPTTTESEQLTSMSKQKATSALGQVKIVQIDSDGKPIETWTLWNAFLTKVTPSALDYGTEDMSEIDMEFTYDWATLEVLTDGADGTDISGQKKFWSTDGSTDPYPGS